MIERIVLFKFKNGHGTPAARAAAAAYSREVLPTMRGVQGSSAGIPADARAEAWDLAVVVRFGSTSDLAALKACPIHQEYMEYLSPLVEHHEAWNFEI
jgi:hypothetical protein